MWANIITRIRTEDGEVFGFKIRVNQTSSVYKDFLVRIDECIEHINSGLIRNAVVVNGETGLYVRAKTGNFKEGIVKTPDKVNKNIFISGSNKFKTHLGEVTKLEVQDNSEKKAENETLINPVKIEDVLNKAYERKIDDGDVKKHGFELSKTIKDKHSGMTVEKKIVKSLILLQKLRPFYGILYQSLNRIEEPSLQTMGVTIDTLAFNPEFVAELEMPELLFVHMHEILHIAMLHPSRGREKVHTVYNIACDLIVNKMLQEEFNLQIGRDTVVNGVTIRMPTHVLYDGGIDLKVESADTIYKELMKSVKDKRVNTKSGKSFSTDENSLANQKNKDIYYDDDMSDSDKKGETSASGDNKDDSKKDKKLESVADQRERNRKQEKVRSKVQGALTRSRLLAGDGVSSVERMIQDAIAPIVDWRKILRKYMTDVAETYSSLSNPDKRYIGRNIIIPSDIKLEPSIIKAMKICIDTSGSISNTDLGIAYKQIKGIFDAFKTNINQLDAEVVYWDTEIESKGMFNTMSDFSKIKPKGFGGTDVNCVFEYFETKECKIKPNVIVIFTDGQFYTQVNKKWKYTKNVIWVINGNEKAFKPPFGKVAKFIGEQ